MSAAGITNATRAWLHDLLANTKTAPRPWFNEEDADCWELYGAAPFLGTSPMIGEVYGHPLKILKAPKRNSPYAEYWPRKEDAELLIAAVNHLGALLEALDVADREQGKSQRLLEVAAQMANVVYNCQQFPELWSGRGASELEALRRQWDEIKRGGT